MASKGQGCQCLSWPKTVSPDLWWPACVLSEEVSLWLYLQVVGDKQWPRNNTAAAVRAQLAARCDAVFVVAKAQHGHSFEGDSPLTLQ